MPKIFKSMHIANWRQFRDVGIEFHDRLTILTGGNGAGKTTLLNILSRHFGWNGYLVSTPRRKGAQTIFTPDYWSESDLEKYKRWLISTEIEEAPQPAIDPSQLIQIGTLQYANDTTAMLKVPGSVNAQFQIQIEGEQTQQGMHVPSHRPIFSHQSVENIPTQPRRRAQAYASYLEIIRARHYGGSHQRTPNYYMKETLIALAAFGHGNAVIERDEESLRTFEEFQGVLKKILPPSLGFLRIQIRLPEVVLITRSGDFSLDAVSGGISSLIDLAWQIFMYTDEGTNFAVTLDEPENHLHPELQRTVLNTLLSAFPNVQFICATHNPFIVTSVPESNVYALRHGDDHRVRSESLSTADRSGSSNEILRDVLGLPSASPTWVDQELAQTQSDLIGKDLTPELVAELRARLQSVGLERFIPASLAKLAEHQATR